MSQESPQNWLAKNGNAVQAIASVVTVLIALAALIGVKFQIDAAARAQQEQSARDIYREFLTLSISRPEFAEPEYCAIKGSAQESAYRNYVDYLLYTSEQILSVSPDWEGALADHLSAHAQYLCSVEDWSGYPEMVTAMITRSRAKLCARPAKTCGDEH